MGCPHRRVRAGSRSSSSQCRKGAPRPALSLAVPFSDSQPCPQVRRPALVMMKSAGSCILCTAGETTCSPCKGSSAVLLSPTRSCSPPHAARLYRYRQIPQSRNNDEGSLPFRLRSVPSPTHLSIIRTELYAGHHLHYSRPHDDLQHPQLVVALLRGEPQLVIPIELALLAGFFIVRARLSTRPRTSGVNP